ncbi:MAG: GreA/GreB family elongation factor, partial [Thermoleophilaceae bacterium]|nr:GreA/GreB family elongation factor [Thermoleophilaceae bacterium]
SPVGRALFGRAAGDDIDVPLPNGVITLRVESVENAGG